MQCPCGIQNDDQKIKMSTGIVSKEYGYINRRSIRLKGFDYSLSGAYFITICTQNRECMFGEIVNNEMRLNEYGKTANKCWTEIPKHFPNIELDEFVVMPNHLHGIIVINETISVGAGLAPAQSLPIAPVLNDKNNDVTADTDKTDNVYNNRAGVIDRNRATVIDNNRATARVAPTGGKTFL
ncbi:MAG: hypothetical protein JXN64_12325 [Spirochaetes bacterium]|nr:hypothetical protein [Spirochaetota bacterium]